jgi:hypothetical protein
LWTYTKIDGTQLPISPGKTAAIASGIKLDFGKAIGEI